MKEITKKQFFKDVNWEKLRKRDIDPESVPYLPNPNKYRYLLQNTYEETTNLLVPSADSPDPIQTKKLLGDFTLYKVNKEFENF